MSEIPGGALAGNVRAVMAARRVRGTQMAAALGLDQRALSRRYRGDTEWRPSELVKVAEVLGVSVSALIEGDGFHASADPVATEPIVDEDAERRRELLGDRVDELLEICKRLTADIDRTRIALELIQRELRDL